MSLSERFSEYLEWKKQAKRLEDLCHRHPLQYLFLEISRRCNLACAYCGSSCTPEAWKNELTIDEWMDVVRRIAREFPAKQVMIAITGGEPLLKEGIFDLLDLLGELGFRFGMVSNGQLLDEEAARRIVASKLGSISLSMDALPEINDRLRGKGVSAKVEQAVKNLQNAGYKGKLEILSTVTKPALTSLDDMRRYVASLKVPLWRLATVIPIGRAARREDLLLDEEDLRYLLEYIKTARQDRRKPIPEYCEEGYVGEFETLVRPYHCQCRAGITVGGIKHNGKIGACPEISDCFDQGDIRKESFRVVWENRYQVMRDRSWMKKGVCSSCKVFDRCHGGALHLYENTRSDPHRCAYLMCEQARKQQQNKAAGENKDS